MNIANESISAKDIDDISAKVLKNAKDLQGIAKIAKRKSIMTMAQPGMYQYPLVASSAIDTETLMAIAKSYQLTYASSVATAYSLNPIMYTNDTPELSDFVKKFHTNSDSLLDANINGVANTLGINISKKIDNVKESDTDISDGDIVVESANIINSYSKEDYAVINSTAWDDIRDSLSMESLNNIYRPYDRVYRIMSEKLNSMSTANEGLLEDINKRLNSNGEYNQTIPIKGNNSEDHSITYKYDKNGNIIEEKVNNRTQNGGTIMRTFKNEVVRNTQLDNMEPSMVNVQIVAHGDRNQTVHNLTLGVKVMARVISSDLMIASMIEACKQSQSIFKFLKWTKGEVKTLDFILGISAAKSKALEKNAKQEVKWLKQSAARKKVNGIGKFLKNEQLPTMSVVLTTYEVARIKEATSINLSELASAMKIMKKYFLLSIAIYDPDQNTIKFLFDCDSDWGIISVGAMKTAVNKTNDILNSNEVLKLTGRR